MVGSACREPEKAQPASICGTMVPPGGCPSNRSQVRSMNDRPGVVTLPSLKCLWQIAPTPLSSHLPHFLPHPSQPGIINGLHVQLDVFTACPVQVAVGTPKVRFLFCTWPHRRHPQQSWHADGFRGACEGASEKEHVLAREGNPPSQRRSLLSCVNHVPGIGKGA